MKHTPNRSPLAVYTVLERESGRKHWLRIGTAFENRDGSFNVRVDALPLNGMIHIREMAGADKTVETVETAPARTQP